MKTTSVNIKFHHIIFFALIALLFFYGFKDPKENLENEYMSISIETHRNYRLVFLSKTGEGVKKIAFVNPQKDGLKKRLQRNGYEVNEKRIKSNYDNRTTFDLILSLEKEGWELKSHSLGIGKSDEHSTIRVSEYLMSRQKKQ